MNMCCCCEKYENWCRKGVLLDIYDTVECAGSTIGRQTVDKWLGFVRLLFACYDTFIVIWSFWDFAEIGRPGLWFFYITHWGLLFNCTYLWSITVLHFKVYRGISEKLNGETTISNLDKYPTINDLNLRKYWEWTFLVLDSSIAWSIFVIILYYSLLGDPPISVKSWHTHGVSGGMVLIEWFTSCWQLSYRGAITTVIAALAWITLSGIFYASGARNAEDNGRYIYSVIDWSPDNIGGTIGYCVGITLVLPICHMLLVYAKNHVLACWLNSRTKEEKMLLVINDDDDDNNNPGQTELV